MLIEAAIKGLVTPGKTLNKLKANPTVISTLTDYIAEVEKLLQLPFVIAEVTEADIAESHKLNQRGNSCKSAFGSWNKNRQSRCRY